jgi:hypothetical protein
VPGVGFAGERQSASGREGGEAGPKGTEALRTPKARGRQEAEVPGRSGREYLAEKGRSLVKFRLKGFLTVISSPMASCRKLF